MNPPRCRRKLTLGKPARTSTIKDTGPHTRQRVRVVLFLAQCMVGLRLPTRITLFTLPAMSRLPANRM